MGKFIRMRIEKILDPQSPDSSALPNEVIVYRGIMYRKSLQILQSVYYVSKGQTIHHSI